MPFTHILVPTDLSDPANHALRYALEEATLHRAAVTLLHVLSSHDDTDVYYVTGSPQSTSQGSFDPAPPQPTVVRSDPNEEARTRLQDLLRGVFHGPWDVEVGIGHPADTIVRVAQERGADLIVMGTHGRTGLQHALLGSVAEKVVRLAPCPVLTVRYKSVPNA